MNSNQGDLFMKATHRRLALALTSAFLLAPVMAQAQGYPTKPVRLIVPFGTGGTTDIVARVMSEPLGKALGQPVVIENKAGGGGTVGSAEVARATPDGYILGMATVSTTAANPAINPKTPYNPITDFTHIGLLVEAPNVLLVKSESRFKTLADYLGAAKTQPVRFGSSGIGSAPHLLGAMLSGEAKVTNLDHVPYRGSAPAMQDLMANQIESLIDPITTNVQLMKDGVLRALANVLGCSVIVFRAGAKPLQFDPKGEERSVSGAGGRRQLRISFHAHQLSAGEHYNSVRERGQ
jgi:tripartite-type tricarboxylate transporter receptor subunit TctC